MDFGSIVGQKEVVSSLINSISSNRVGHAYILNGPVGIGKRTIAKIFAQLLSCENSSDGRSCNKCRPCEMFEFGTNPDFRVLESNESTIGVDDIRKIMSDLIIRPLYSPRKVYVIAGAENMTTQAQNCLLKTLEEPPEYAVIILTTSNLDALLETIRSRAIRYNFKKNSYNEVREVLLRKNNGSLKNIDFITSYADGIIGKALEISDSGEFFDLREKALEILLKLKDSNLLDVFGIYNFFEANKENSDTILDIMLLFYRDILVYQKTGKENVLINYDKKDIILSNVSGFTTGRLTKSIEIIELTRKNIKQNANYQLSIEVMLMKLQEE